MPRLLNDEYPVHPGCLQIANALDDIVPCNHCENNLLEVGHHIYINTISKNARSHDELCRCKKCGKLFLLRYAYFDSESHINGFVFQGDINDPNYNWQDSLTPLQKKEIENHLSHCQQCRDSLDNEIMTDAQFASFIHSIKRG